MARKLDQILVIDVESTCWDGPTPDGQSSEIIEIGVCTVDVHSLERLDRCTTRKTLLPARAQRHR